MSDNTMIDIARLVLLVGGLVAAIGAIMLLVKSFLCIASGSWGKLVKLFILPIIACFLGYAVTLAIGFVALKAGSKLDSFTAVIIMMYLIFYAFGLAGIYSTLRVRRETLGDSVNV